MKSLEQHLIIKTMKKYIIAILVLIFLASCNHQKSENKAEADYHEKCRRLVLSENKIGQDYSFKISGKIIDEISITYLGETKTKQDKVLRFLNSTNFTGLYEDARRANSSIYIYDGTGHKLGSYYVGSLNSLPNKIEDGRLIFLYSNETCNQTTSISFTDSIPRQIFVSCTKNGGNLYTFQTK